MDVKICQHPPTTLVGLHRSMSLADNQTAALWQQFMPQRDRIVNRLGEALYSLQVYDPNAPNKFNPHTLFTKWALAPVSSAVDVPESMATFELSGGLYAVFEYIGPAKNAPQVFGYIFGQWLPTSGYELDDRPHFEILQPGYNPNADDATEAIWIPISAAASKV